MPKSPLRFTNSTPHGYTMWRGQNSPKNGQKFSGQIAMDSPNLDSVRKRIAAENKYAAEHPEDRFNKEAIMQRLCEFIVFAQDQAQNGQTKWGTHLNNSISILSKLEGWSKNAVADALSEILEEVNK